METQDQAFARRVKEGYERQRRNRMSDEVRGIVEAGERVREAVAAWPPASGDRERWARWDELLQGIGDINGQLVDLTAELVERVNKDEELIKVWREGLTHMADEPDRPGPDHAALAKILLEKEE